MHHTNTTKMTSFDASVARLAGSLAEIERSKHRVIVLDTKPTKKCTQGPTTKIVTRVATTDQVETQTERSEKKPEIEKRQAIGIKTVSVKAMPKKSNLRKLLNGKKFDISKK